MYWLELKKDAEDLVQHCDTCQCTKSSNLKYGKLSKINVESDIWATITVNLVTFETHSILSIIDMASR